jgi:hypothetical protein
MFCAYRHGLKIKNFHGLTYSAGSSSRDPAGTGELKDMKGPRNLFIHFDKTPSIVYDELQKQNIEKITVKTIPFMNILTSMIKFNQVLLDDYNVLITTRKNNMLDTQYEKFEELKRVVGNNPEALDMLKKMQDFIKGRKTS